ncbi:MAG: Nif3-like dinuclear metal center hexameric protein [Acidaminococcaceae bacterium]|nr:Nif3-like dinuclear metal center hexameric protein [Acidaminococcaceae bacterium]MDD4721618.1 Nif3-like dinuclear metal center hexameric protein [Acidaminococcaceae bacterium]
MKTTVADICWTMNEIAPIALAESWDNPGLLVGKVDAPVKKIMLALDLTLEVAEQAIEAKVDMIITHHPLYFNLPKTLAVTDAKMECVYALIKSDIAVYAAHTNLDAAVGGVNDVLAELLSLTQVVAIENPEHPEQGLGRIGVLSEPLTLEAFAQNVKKVLAADGIAFADAGKPVYKVAVVGGAGSDFIAAALDAGADTFVTGDLKYHVAQKALDQGINVIDAGHQFTEMPVVTKLEQVLSSWAEENKRTIEIILAEEEQILRHL